ncbi:MAG: glycosyltransferase involved in cell wall biosynthesis [Crocinitomicaceae bacterium]|jgi:glycosyltransferase involved in cell wall biosynthesis
MQKLEFSLIVPVYNRPVEVEELFESLVMQTNKNFEVVIVEDGSTEKSDEVVKRYQDRLDIKYFYKENTGPGISRNYGYDRAKGNYCIFLDSDCILPPQYFQTVVDNLKETYVDAFGGPDKAHESFTDLQKAINYSMTSFFTTGGIRGGGEKLDKFYPRSFNMGFSREVFEETGGFPSHRFAKAKAAGEDMDLSITIKKKGFSTALFKSSHVYHKRRTSWSQFRKQVTNFGYARITIYKRHPESLKWLHFAPAVFVVGILSLILLSIFVSPLFLLPIPAHVLMLFIDASIQNKSIVIGAMAVVTSYIQLIGYGLGFMKAIWNHVILGKEKVPGT